MNYIQKELVMCPRCGFRTVHIFGKCTNHPENRTEKSLTVGPDFKPLRIVFLGPVFWQGGAERWVSILAHGLCPDRFVTTAISTSHPLAPVTPEALSWFPRHVVHIPWPRVKDVDIVISSGQIELPEIVRMFLADNPGTLWVDVQHGAFRSANWQIPMIHAATNAHRFHGIKLVAVSPECLGNFERDIKIVAIPSGSDPAKLVPTAPPSFIRTRYGIPEGVKVVLFLSRISVEKQPGLFANTMSYLPDCFGLMAGVNPGGVSIRIPPNVRMLGGVANLGNLFNVCDVLCMPSHGEGHCFAVNEAWLAGVPVVATAYPVLEGQCQRHGKLAERVPLPGSVETLTAAIRKVLAGGPDVQSMIDHARKTALAEFSAEVMCRRWSEFLWTAAGYTS